MSHLFNRTLLNSRGGPDIQMWGGCLAMILIQRWNAIFSKRTNRAGPFADDLPVYHHIAGVLYLGLKLGPLFHYYRSNDCALALEIFFRVLSRNINGFDRLVCVLTYLFFRLFYCLHSLLHRLNSRPHLLRISGTHQSLCHALRHFVHRGEHLFHDACHLRHLHVLRYRPMTHDVGQPTLQR